MARGVNKVILIGNLGSTPEVRYLNSGDPVANFSIATSESWKDKQTGESQERTEWHRITVYKRLAEIAEQYLSKGSKVYIEGSLRTRKWQDKEGIDRHTTEVIASNMQMLDSRNDRAATSTSASAEPREQTPKKAAFNKANTDSSNGNSQDLGNVETEDDDIPF